MVDSQGEITTPDTDKYVYTQFAHDLHGLKQIAGIMEENAEPFYLEAIASLCRIVRKGYDSSVLFAFSDDHVTPPKNMWSSIEGQLTAWQSGDTSPNFGYLSTFESFKDNLPNHFDRIQSLYANLRHDALVAINPLQLGLEGIPEYEKCVDQSLAQWPSHVIERVARQIAKGPEIEELKPGDTYDYLDKLFSVLPGGNPNFSVKFDIDPDISIRADKLFFEGMNFNPIRNSQNMNAENVIVSLQEEGDTIVLKIRDDAGGFPDHLLKSVDRKDLKGEIETNKDGTPKKIKKALQRGTTKRDGGSGLGLDITRQFAEEHLMGTIDIYNEEYPESKKMGAVVEIRFPNQKHSVDMSG